MTMIKQLNDEIKYGIKLGVEDVSCNIYYKNVLTCTIWRGHDTTVWKVTCELPLWTKDDENLKSQWRLYEDIQYSCWYKLNQALDDLLLFNEVKMW